MWGETGRDALQGVTNKHVTRGSITYLPICSNIYPFAHTGANVEVSGYAKQMRGYVSERKTETQEQRQRQKERDGVRFDISLTQAKCVRQDSSLTQGRSFV